MRRPTSLIVSCLVGLIFMLAQPTVDRAATDDTNRFPAQLLSFSAAKGRQVHQLATDLNIPVPSEIGDFFRAASRGDYITASNKFARLKPQFAASYKGRPVPWAPLWQPLIEVISGYEQFASGGMKYQLAFGEGIIKSIPPGSIYFGGTDPGRGLVTVLCKSQMKGDPFYTLTQNALADRRYLDYLSSMYGGRIYIPTTNDWKNAYADYTADVQRRLNHDRDFTNEPPQIQRGEDVTMENGKLQMTGAVSVMAFSSRLVKITLDHNPDTDFYMEESYPLDLIYPYLAPHDLIFKLNHQPLPALTPEMMDADHAFWSNQCEAMLGGWLTSDTSLSKICQFVETVHGRGDFSNFPGDREFVTNTFATKAFSKLRSSVGGLYAWRLTSKLDTSDKMQLRREADYAFRQAFALCPTSPEAIYRYVNFLAADNRLNDAILLLRTARRADPDNSQLDGTLDALLKMRDQQRTRIGKD